MKWLTIGAGIILVSLAVVYILLFTAPGNVLLAPIIVKKIDRAIDLQTTLEKFELRTGRFAVTLLLTGDNRIEAEGGFGLFGRSLTATYRVSFNDLPALQPLTKITLYDKFQTSGTVTGSYTDLHITGTSDIAASQTSYDVTLENLQPRQVLVRMVNGQLAKLIHLAGHPAAATGRLDIDLTMTDLDPENLKGEGEVKISRGELDSTVFKKAYDISLPQTPFACSLNATLKGREISYRTRFDSTLAKINSEGSFSPKTMGMDLVYRLDIARLELLQPVIGTPLRGALKLSGTAQGDRQMLNVAGESDLAGGKTTFRAGLSDFALASITAKIKNLQLGRALYMAAQPHYCDGVLNAEINIGAAGAGGFTGSVTSEISQGRLDGKVLAAAFALGAMPDATFTANTKTTLAGKVIDTATTFDSSLLTLKMQRSRYDLNDSLLTSDYQADIPDLDRFFFVIGRHLKGTMTVKGELAKGEHFKLTANADTLGGRVEVTVLDDDVHADIKKIQTLAALKMLIYPEILASALDGVLDYNLAQKKGLFTANLSYGKFTRNIMLDLLLNLARIDLYKERFAGTLNSMIKQEQITSDLDLRSNSSSIIARKATLNSETKQLAAKLDVLANNNPVTVVIRGKVDKPDVKLDTSALIQKEAVKVLEKEVGKLLRNLFK